MLLDLGLDAPIFYCTAWGSPIPGRDILPAFGGYAYPTWIENPPPSDLFLFRDLHESPDSTAVGWQPGVYPAANAEMQGGIQIRYNNRPVVDPKSTEALALVRLGGGSNWLGYYIYHGGSQAVGPMGRMNERLHPRVSYDFQAPISEFGQITPSYRYLKRLHLFAQEFAGEIAAMKTILPTDAGRVVATDTTTLRYCLRSQGGRGFVFLNNFQDHVQMGEQRDCRITITLPDGDVTLPHGRGFTLRRNACAIFPFNQMLNGIELTYATAQLVTRVENHGTSHYFFFAPDGTDPEYCFDAATVQHVSGQQSLLWEGERLFVSVIPGADRILRRSYAPRR